MGRKRKGKRSVSRTAVSTKPDGAAASKGVVATEAAVVLASTGVDPVALAQEASDVAGDVVEGAVSVVAGILEGM